MKSHLVTTLFISLSGCANSSRPIATVNFALSNQTIVVPAKLQDPATCESFQKSLPKEERGGYITTTEKTAKSERKVQIFYYGKWKSKPLIIANGGPGGSSWSTYKALRDALNREDVEYLFFDQKGTGCSSDYPPLDKNHFSTWQNYDSRGLAADIETLRKKLQLGSQISIFGHSFGSKIAIR